MPMVLLLITPSIGTHIISVNRVTVSRIADILYFLPEYNGKQDCLCPAVDAELVEEMKTQCEMENVK